MNDCDDEDLRDDCEIEFSDLPLEEERDISGQLFRQGSHLWMRASGIVLGVSRTWTSVWRWLLSEVQGNSFADGSSRDAFELELVDLPPGRFYGVSKAFTVLGAHLSPRPRLRRLVMTGSTVLLALLLLLGGFPSTRDWIYNLFAGPTPTYTASLTEQSSLIGSSGVGSGSPPSLQAPVQVWG